MEFRTYRATIFGSDTFSKWQFKVFLERRQSNIRLGDDAYISQKVC